MFRIFRESDQISMTQFNPGSPLFRADPYPVYHRLRARTPIHYRHEQGDWILTRHADIVALLKDERIDPRHGVKQARAKCRQDPSDRRQEPSDSITHRFLRLREESQRLRSHWIITTNPPAHTRLRKALGSSFTQGKIRALEPHIQTIADALIHKALSSGSLDIIGAFASPLIVDAISTVLGVPLEDRERLALLAYDLSISIDLDAPRATSERGRFALAGLTRYFGDLITRVRRDNAKPQDNLIGAMIRAHEQGELSEEELLANSVFLFFTGQGAPQHIIGNGMLALLRHPEQLRLLQEDPTRIETAIDECLRYDCPGQYIVRRALADIEIGGKTIQRGQRVVFVIGAANRDHAEFPEPDRFDICRSPNRYLTFGHGMRYCMGAHLARSVARIGVGTLVRRLPRIALRNESLEWEPSYRTHGLKALPVTFR
uniref:Cytochrome P450 n=1 Tax=Candidatus Kentrum sp. LPFa TaxID=2126335 RepID=A0A450W8Z1_9GAMM|nr:MAG: hypothetical protein BECKLPF1236B_GA0070989_104819 [Candidatus Kentron sp. LPFa]